MIEKTREFVSSFFTMERTSPGGIDFVPTASIVALVFVGLFLVFTLIGRCLALNQSSSLSSQSLDLMIYRVPPKAMLAQKSFRLPNDNNFDGMDGRERTTTIDEFVIPVPVQRGPKNL